jgi:hypothetical protein
MKTLLIALLLIAACGSPTCEEALDNYINVCGGHIGECIEASGYPIEENCLKWIDREWYFETYCEAPRMCPFEEWLECLDGIKGKAQCGDCWGHQWRCEEE